MNLHEILLRRLNVFPDIKPGQLKMDLVKVDSVQRCAEMTEINPGSNNIPNQLMFPSLFRNKRKKVKK